MRLLSALLLLILSVNIYTQEAKEISSLEDISFPKDWDDAIIDSLAGGKTVKHTLAVLDFDGMEKLAGKVALSPSDILITALNKTKAFEIIERSKLQKIIEEQNLQMSGLINESTAVEMGNLTGAEYLISGSITTVSESKVDKFAYELEKIEVGIDIRIISTTSGAVVRSESAVGLQEEKIIKTSRGELISGAIDYNTAYSQALRKGIEQAANEIAGISIICGYVVSAGNDYTIDVGAEGGIKKGDLLMVVRLAEPILHPITKKKIGWNKKIIAAIKAESVQKNMTVCSRFLADDKETIKAGDVAVVIGQGK